MDRKHPLQERVALAFLERVVEDRAQGGELPLEQYLRMFPGHEQRLRHEWEQLHSETQPASEPARRLGPYRLAEVLGRGGQGVVYRAVDERIGRVVALKLLAGISLDGELPARVRRELEAIARLDHPALGIVYEAGQHGGQVFIAMRYVPGRSLAVHIAERAAAANNSGSRADRDWQRTALTWIETLARALHTAHAAGVLHRDVKPANVMIHESGDPVLLDFGLARSDDTSLETLTVSGELIGTTAYMAPERLLGQGRDDRRADVWSLGVMLYELLVGQRPFEAASLDELSWMIRCDEPVDPRRRRRSLSRDAAVVLEHALEKDPERRYASAADLAEDVGRLLSGRPILARPVSALGRLRRWAGRHPTTAGLGLALLAALAASSWVAMRFADLARDEAGLRRTAETLLVRSGTEQAELLSLSASPGRRWRMLELLADAARRRAQLASPLPDDVPDLLRLRELTTAALLLSDVRHLRTIQRSSYGSGGFGPDGKTLAQSWITADFGSYGIRLIELSTGEQLALHYEGDHISRGFAVALDSRAERYATVRRDVLGVALWDAVDGRRLADYEVPEALLPRSVVSAWKLAFLPGDELLLAVCSPGHARDDPTTRLPAPHGWVIWDLASGQPRAFAAATAEIQTWLSISPDQRQLLLPEESRVVRRIALADFSSTLLTLPEPVMSAVLTAAVDDGGLAQIVAVVRPAGSASDELLRLSSAGELLAKQPLPGRVNTLAPLRPSADGRWLAIADEQGNVHLADVLSLRVQLTLPPGSPREVTDMLFVESSSNFLTHSPSETTDAWELALDTGLEQILPLIADGPLALSPDGRLLAVITGEGPGVVALWDLDAGRPGPRLSLPDNVTVTTRLTFDASGTRLAASNKSQVWTWTLGAHDSDDDGDDDGDGAALAQLQPACDPAPVVDIAFDSGGRLLVLHARPGSTATLALPETGVTRQLPGDTATARLGLDGGGRRLLAVSTSESLGRSLLAKGALRLHDLAAGTATELSGIPPAAFRSVHRWSFSPDGDQLLAQLELTDDIGDAGDSSSPERTIEIGGQATHNVAQLMLWELPSGTLAWARPHDDQTLAVRAAIDPAGSLLAMARVGGRIVLLDGRDGTELVSWQAHDAALQALYFVGRGSRLLSRDTSGGLHVWDLAALRRELEHRALGF